MWLFAQKEVDVHVKDKNRGTVLDYAYMSSKGIFGKWLSMKFRGIFSPRYTGD